MKIGIARKPLENHEITRKLECINVVKEMDVVKETVKYEMKKAKRWIFRYVIRSFRSLNVRKYFAGKRCCRDYLLHVPNFYITFLFDLIQLT